MSSRNHPLIISCSQPTSRAAACIRTAVGQSTSILIFWRSAVKPSSPEVELNLNLRLLNRTIPKKRNSLTSRSFNGCRQSIRPLLNDRRLKKRQLLGIPSNRLQHWLTSRRKAGTDKAVSLLVRREQLLHPPQLTVNHRLLFQVRVLYHLINFTMMSNNQGLTGYQFIPPPLPNSYFFLYPWGGRI